MFHYGMNNAIALVLFYISLSITHGLMV